VRSKEVPRADEGASHLAARFSADLFSGNDQVAGDIEFMGAIDRIGFRGSLSGRNSGNTRTPTGTLSNSGEEQTNFGGAFAYHHDRFSFDIDYLHFDQLLEIHEDPNEDPLATPRQDITHDRVHAHLLLPTRPFRFELHSGWQRNHRRELESIDATDPVLHLDLATFTTDLKAHHAPIRDISGTIGISLIDQHNRSRAAEKLIPEFANLAWGAFLFEEYSRDKFVLSIGARIDQHTLDIRETIGEEDFFVPSQSLDYSSFSGSVGAVYHLSDAVSLAGNIGRAWRAPTAFELFIDGVHEGTHRYEIGTITLAPERSLALDGSLRINTKTVSASLSLYRNMIDRFIYITPTGDVDAESGFDIFTYRQADASLTGGEFSIQYALSSHWVLGAGYDLVRGRNDELDLPLPLIPADRIMGTLRWNARSLSRTVLHPFAEIEMIGIMEQNRVSEFEEPSRGRVTFNFSGGFEVPLGDEHLLIDAGIKNVLNQQYRDHLSRYRAYADNPGMNAYLKFSIPLTFVR
jgi:iron complex outermembrane receptor protein